MDAYSALRTGRLRRDLSGRATFRLEGKDRVRFLHNLCTNDIQGLRPGAGCLASIVDRTGKLTAVFTVRAHDDHLFLTAPSTLKIRLRETVEHFAIMDDVRLVPAEGPVTGVFGPAAVDEVRTVPIYHSLFRAGKLVVRVPFGYEVSGERAADPGAEEAWEIFRIESGVPEWGAELDETVLPVEAGLDSAVSYSKGCYIGQEVLLRLKNFSEPKQQLRGVLLDRPAAPGPIPEGRLTSVGRSPGLGREVALAILRKEHLSPGAPISAGVVASLPFLPAAR